MLNSIRLVTALAATGLVANTVAAQDINVRTPQQLDTTSTGVGLNPSVGSDGNLSVISYFDSGTDTVSVSVSDGRGIDWTGPARVDDDMTASNKLSQYDSCIVINENTYVIWKDERLGSSSDRIAFTRSVQGSVFSANTLLEEGYAGTGKVVAWRFAGSEGPLADGTDDNLFVAMTSDGPSTNEELFLTWSTDAGANWNTPIQVAGDSFNGFDIDGVAVTADGPIAHLMWDDNTSSGSTSFDSIYYRQFDSTTATLGPVIQLDSTDTLDAGDSAPTGTFNFEIDAQGDLVVAAWAEERLDATDEELRVAVSTDGGVSFGPDELVGNYDVLAGEEVDFLTVAIADGNIVCAYTDNREVVQAGTGTSLDQAYVAVAIDPLNNPLVFNEIGKVSGPEGSGALRIATAGGRDVGLTWTSDLSGDQFTGGVYSLDGGLTWSDEVVVSNVAPGIDADIAELGYNATYGNFIHSWLSNDFATNNVFAGGYRPASIAANGFVAGATSINFDFANLVPNSDNVNAAVFLSASLAEGSFVLPGGIETGLGFDALLLTGLDFLTLLSGPIDAAGNASTPVLPVSLPPGVTIFATGIGFKSGAGSVDRITDTIQIDF